MEAHNSCDEKVEKLQADVECLRKENETLRFLLGVMSSKYNVLQAHLQERNAEQTGLISLTGGSGSDNETNKRPRTEVPTPNKTSRIFVRTDPRDNSLVVKDGYQWRKYGQKVTKDNPSPRAYFRCSMSPGCPVKKKVQRCLEDKSVLLATYDGQHNHSAHGSLGGALSSSTAYIISPPSMASNHPPRPSISLDLSLSGPNQENRRNFVEEYGYNNNNNSIEEYLASLTKDPNFTATLAAAVASSLTHQPKLSRI